MNIIIHPTAIVDDGAQVGDGSRIWHWVHISGGAKLAELLICQISLGKPRGDWQHLQKQITFQFMLRYIEDANFAA